MSNNQSQIQPSTDSLIDYPIKNKECRFTIHTPSLSYDQRLRKLGIKDRDLMDLCKLAKDSRVVFKDEVDMAMFKSIMYDGVKHAKKPRLMIKVFKRLELLTIVAIEMEPGVTTVKARNYYGGVMTKKLRNDRYLGIKHLMLKALESFEGQLVEDKAEWELQQEKELAEYRAKFMEIFPNFSKETLEGVGINELKYIVDSKAAESTTTTGVADAE